MDWEELKSEMMLRFGTAPYEDGFGELYKLKETQSVREYQSKFERLLGKAGILMDKQETSCFISRLREPSRADVKNPTYLSSAIGLSQIYECKGSKVKKRFRETKPTSYVKPNPYGKTSPSSRLKNVEGMHRGGKVEFPVRRFTPAELKKKGENKACAFVVMRDTHLTMSVKSFSG